MKKNIIYLSLILSILFLNNKCAEIGHIVPMVDDPIINFSENIINLRNTELSIDLNNAMAVYNVVLVLNQSLQQAIFNPGGNFSEAREKISSDLNELQAMLKGKNLDKDMNYNCVFQAILLGETSVDQGIDNLEIHLVDSPVSKLDVDIDSIPDINDLEALGIYLLHIKQKMNNMDEDVKEILKKIKGNSLPDEIKKIFLNYKDQLYKIYINLIKLKIDLKINSFKENLENKYSNIVSEIDELSDLILYAHF